jgi:uncharacterized protein YaiE (UPF0345 family)
MYKLRKYHGDRVQSLTFEKDGRAGSVGIMDAGEYEFGAVEKETFTVCDGEIMVKVGKETEWKHYNKGETFVIPEHTDFKLKTGDISTYYCVYG